MITLRYAIMATSSGPGARSQRPWPWRHQRLRRCRCRRAPGQCEAEGVRRVPLLSADPAAFPAEPPADTHDPAVTAAHDWAAFSALDEMTDHWARPGWSDGSRAYYWMLTFPNDQRLATLAGHCQEELAPSASTRCRRTDCTSPSPESERWASSPPASWTAWHGTPRRCCPPRSPYTPCRWRLPRRRPPVPRPLGTPAPAAPRAGQGREQRRSDPEEADVRISAAPEPRVQQPPTPRRARCGDGLRASRSTGCRTLRVRRPVGGTPP